MDGPHTFVDDLGAPVLDEHDRHHLDRVLRLRAGDPLTVSDGRGGWRLCRFGPDLEAVGDVHRVERPTPPVMIGFALVKGERPEWVVQKLTELGVDRIVAFAAARSVVRWDVERGERNLTRLRRVAREAAMQSRRCHLPAVEVLGSFADAVSAGGGGVAMADRGGDPPSLDRPSILVGPEGGWAPDERALDLPRVRLGPHVLRAETAAVAAGSLLCGLRDAIVSDQRRAQATEGG